MQICHCHAAQLPTRSFDEHTYSELQDGWWGPSANVNALALVHQLGSTPGQPGMHAMLTSAKTTLLSLSCAYNTPGLHSPFRLPLWRPARRCDSHAAQGQLQHISYRAFLFHRPTVTCMLPGDPHDRLERPGGHVHGGRVGAGLICRLVCLLCSLPHPMELFSRPAGLCSSDLLEGGLYTALSH